MARILVAEDDPKNREILGDNLEDWGYQVTSTRDGAEALERANHGDFDLILSDWMMPRMTGIKLCESLKQNENTRHIPVVILSTKDSKEDIAQAYDVGAHDYISKPSKKDDLQNRLAKALTSNA
jgi:CheY-like chemotaxis protein